MRQTTGRRCKSEQVTPHGILGRRYQSTTDLTAPDFTVISYSTGNDSTLVHYRSDSASSNGRAGFRVIRNCRQYLRLSEVLRAIASGLLIESILAPFVLERTETVR